MGTREVPIFDMLVPRTFLYSPMAGWKTELKKNVGVTFEYER